MPVHGARPTDWAVQVAAIPRPINAGPRCAALGDFASPIHFPGRPTGPPPEAGISPYRQGTIGALIRRRWPTAPSVTTWSPRSGFLPDQRTHACHGSARATRIRLLRA